MASLRGTVLFAVFALSSVVSSMSVYDYLATLPNVSRFVGLVNQAGLDDYLRNHGPFTILVPTNDAFNKFSNYRLAGLLTDPTGALKRALQYCMINGARKTPFLHNGQQLDSITGHPIRYSVTRQGMWKKLHFNQALVLQPDTILSNGVVDLIDSVLEAPAGSDLEVLGNPAYNTSIFLDYVKRAGLDAALGAVGRGIKYTVFAPTDAAFMALGRDTRTYFETHSSDLKKLVQHHIHSMTLRMDSFKDLTGAISSLYAGHNIKLTQSGSGGPLLDGDAHVVIPDIETENGVVHVISHVLIPSEFTSIVG